MQMYYMKSYEINKKLKKIKKMEKQKGKREKKCLPWPDTDKHVQAHGRVSAVSMRTADTCAHGRHGERVIRCVVGAHQPRPQSLLP
jgi:hypothetical protein